MKIQKNQIRSSILDAPIVNDNGMLHITFSSETPGQRPYGMEIVKNDPGCVNLEHTKDGLSLLFNHDINQLIGKAENIFINPQTKQGEADIRFFSTSDAQNIKQKVLEGASFISYRYSIDDYEVVKSDNKEELPTVYITKSTPKEISIVSVPFDFNVGINRSDELDEMIDIELEATKEAKEEVEIKIDVLSELLNTEEIKSEPAIKEEIKQTIFIKEHKTMSNERNEILALGTFAEKQGVTKEFMELSGSEKTIDEIRSALVDAINGKQVAISTATKNVEDSKEVSKSFSIGRAMEAHMSNDWSKAGFEKDVQRQWSSKQTNYSGGLIIPHEALKSGNAMNTQTAGQGKEFVYNTYAGFVEMLRPACLAISNGANVVGGLTMNYSYVQETAQPATYWLGENSGTDVTAALDTIQNKVLSPKQLAGQMQYTRTMQVQAPTAFDEYISKRLIREFGIAIDRACFASDVSGGVLTAPANAPTGGILLDAGVPTVAVGNGTSPNNNISTHVASILALKTQLNTNNALNGFNPVFFTTPGLQGVLEATVPPGLTYAGQAYWFNNMMSGFKACSTANLPTTINKGASGNICHAVILGDMSQLTLGVFGDITLMLDPYTLGAQGAVRVIANQLCDVGLVRPTAFAKIVDAVAL